MKVYAFFNAIKYVFIYSLFKRLVVNYRLNVNTYFSSRKMRNKLLNFTELL